MTTEEFIESLKRIRMDVDFIDNNRALITQGEVFTVGTVSKKIVGLYEIRADFVECNKEAVRIIREYSLTPIEER